MNEDISPFNSAAVDKTGPMPTIYLSLYDELEIARAAKI